MPSFIARLAATPVEHQFTSAITVGEMVYGFSEELPLLTCAAVGVTDFPRLKLPLSFYLVFRVGKNLSGVIIGIAPFPQPKGHSYMRVAHCNRSKARGNLAVILVGHDNRKFEAASLGQYVCKVVISKVGEFIGVQVEGNSFFLGGIRS